MTGLDCNILVQLALADHPANAVTVAAVQAETVQGNKLVFPPLVVTEFLHVSTDTRRFAPPLTMTEAVDWIEDFTKNPMVGLVFSTEASMTQTLSWMRQWSWAVNGFSIHSSRRFFTRTVFAGCSHQTSQISRCLTFCR